MPPENSKTPPKTPGNGQGAPPIDSAGSEPQDTDARAAASVDADAAMPTEVAELAASCVRFNIQKYGIELDFSPETLGILDQYVRDGRAELAVKPSLLPLVEASIGAYFGEVVRRTMGGEWRLGREHADWRLGLRHVYLSFNPIGIAREALLGEDAGEMGSAFVVEEADRERIDERLKAAPDVAEQDYYLPSVRFEALQIVVDTLRALAEERDEGSVVYDASDYDD